VVVPSDWKEIKVGEYAHITTGKKNTQDRMTDGKYPFFVRSQNVERINSYSYDGEAVLTAGDGVGTGKVFHYINGKFDCHQRVYQITDFRSDLNGKFFYLLFSQLFYDRIMSMTAKSSVDSVRMEMISEMELVIPSSIREQELIAESLSDADAAIEALDALIAKKRDVRQAAMQQYSQAERVGSDARMVALGSVVVISKGELITSSTSGEGPYPVIAGGKSPAYFSSKFNRDGLTITISASGANAGYVALRKGKIWASDCSTINEDSSIDMNYLAAQLEVRQEKIYRAQFGGAQPHVRPNDLAPLEICYVPLVRQQEIGRALRAMDDELEALTEQVSKLRMVKEGMMHNLLTGKVRLA